MQRWHRLVAGSREGRHRTLRSRQGSQARLTCSGFFCAESVAWVGGAVDIVGARFINSTSDKILANSLVSAARYEVPFCLLPCSWRQYACVAKSEEERSGVEERYGDGILEDKASVIKVCIRCTSKAQGARTD